MGKEIEQRFPAIIYTASAVHWGENLLLALEKGKPTRLLQVGITLFGNYLVNQIEQT